ncbi:Hpt domain-containing protein [Negadavirga shengliensis]|uniref:Hpt domain-containing protein n=1 Tax=Negadavirga shengliensis TaxID=1389218 RepID=A0ABV9T4B6_9BACT
MENPEEKNNKLYDLANLEEISAGSDEFIQQMIQMFIDQAKITIEGLNDSFERKDYQQIKNLAHQIKPSIDNMKIDTLSPVIRQVESLVEENAPPQELSPVIMQTNAVLEAVIVQLEHKLANW